jgi:hypothetical protein
VLAETDAGRVPPDDGAAQLEARKRQSREKERAGRTAGTVIVSMPMSRIILSAAKEPSHGE